MLDAGLLLLRLTSGCLLAGHGAQKLFGVFGGHGLRGTGGFLEGIGLRPGQAWATIAGGSEVGGGALPGPGLAAHLRAAAAEAGEQVTAEIELAGEVPAEQQADRMLAEQAARPA